MSDVAPPRPPIEVGRLGPASLPAGWRLEVVEAAASTNADVAARAAAGEPSGLVLLTEHQTAGRGRLGRVWTTPARACLTFSVLLRPDVPVQHWPWLPLLTGQAVAAVLSRHLDGVGLKWPNDVLVGEAKIAGILVESHQTAAGPAAVIGIGLNVSLTEAELPVATATSLLLAGAVRADGPEHSGALVDRTDLLAALLTELAAAYDRWRATPDSEARASTYAAACVTVGRRVRVELPASAPLIGTAVAVDPAGRLVVATAAGPVPVAAGDVVHVR